MKKSVSVQVDRVFALRLQEGYEIRKMEPRSRLGSIIFFCLFLTICSIIGFGYFCNEQVCALTKREVIVNSESGLAASEFGNSLSAASKQYLHSNRIFKQVIVQSQQQQQNQLANPGLSYEEVLEDDFQFDMDAHDVMVFLHIQKTGGTSFGRHLVRDLDLKMNQTCKVCGEPAAGFHFGAFTCEGCKSFFGRSYNNLSSISECKNNGECVINKKNRTACKACRLRKCLMVGMSKSGSRYGRRSNWFKIHCLLQEQQQAAAAAAASGNRKTPPSHPTGLPLGFHPSTGFTMQRPNNELMLLGLEEYTKLPSAGSSVSSPDSNNSDSSIEISDRQNMLRKMSDHHSPSSNKTSNSNSSSNNNKELFLPLPFSGLASLPMMPPPSFLPQSHLLFPGYHPALYSHHQGLLKPVDQHLVNNSLALHHHHQQQQHLHQNNNSRFQPNHNHPAMFGNTLLNNNSLSISNLTNKHPGSKTAEELTKRFYLDAVLKSQLSPRNGLSVKRRATDDDDEENYQETHVSDENMNGGPEIDRNNNKNLITTKDHEKDEEEEVLDAMTPPRSPISSHLNISPKTTSSKSSSTTKESISSQDNPIDLSMKTSSSTTCSVGGSDLDS